MAGRSFEAAGIPGNQAPAPSPTALPSFKELYQEYFDFVWSSARRHGVELGAMDDLVQEVFMVKAAHAGKARLLAKLDLWSRPAYCEQSSARTAGQC
jgi:hypothetical protein